MDVSIIIVNYNTKDITSDCIDSIVAHTQNIFYEIILVDNASSDGSKEQFQKDHRIVFISSNQNLGFGKANNLGLNYAKGKYVFFLNSDTILRNNAVKLMFDFCENHHELCIGGVGTILINANNQRTHSYGKLPTIIGVLYINMINIVSRRFGKNISDFDNEEETEDFFKVGYITGADLFCPKEVLEKIGGAFDPDFFMYCEETEMQWRMQKRGYERYIVKGPQIIHLEQQSSSGFSDIRKLARSEHSLFIYINKRYNYISYILFRVFFFFLRIFIFFKPSITIEEKLFYFKNLIKRV